MNEQKGEDDSGDIDETKVDIATRFLCNSNVKDTEKAKQEAFLRGKGLSSAEIDLAYERVSKVELGEIDDDSWSLFDYLKGIVLGAGILSAANFAYKAYILPYATRELKDDMRMEGLIESFQAVKDDIKQHTYELTGTLKQIQALMEENQKSLNIINSELKKDTSGAGASSDNELKSEISMIKSMMLSKDQFPATPYSSAKPKINEIPAWQRIADEFNSEKIVEESNVDKLTVIESGLNGNECLKGIHEGEHPLEDQTEELGTPINSSMPETDTNININVVVQHADIAEEESPLVVSTLEVQSADVLNHQESVEDIKEEQLVTEQESQTDIPVTTEVNGILYEVVPNASKVPDEPSTEIFSSEISKEIFVDGTDVLKSEYDLTITQTDKEVNSEENENLSLINSHAEEDDKPCETQDEDPSMASSDGVATET